MLSLVGIEELVGKLPAVDTVKPDDEEAIKAITDAQTAYNALSDYEKSLVDEATKSKCKYFQQEGKKKLHLVFQSTQQKMLIVSALLDC